MGKRRRLMSDTRTPPAAGTIQVNHCRNPSCANFGVPAHVPESRAHVGEGDAQDRAGAQSRYVDGAAREGDRDGMKLSGRRPPPPFRSLPIPSENDTCGPAM